MRKRLLGLAALVATLGTPTLAQDYDEALAADGERVWRQCQACHQIGEDAQNRVGPVLTGVVGRQAGSVEDFNYSDAMRQAGEDGLVWDDANLKEFLENPRGKVPGTSMAYAGLRQEAQRDAIVEYLKREGGTASDS